MSNTNSVSTKKDWVRESQFGRWFLQSDTWVRYVLNVAFKDFNRLMGPTHRQFDRVLDAGCGQGLAFQNIEKYWSPKSIIGVDIDKDLLNLAKAPAEYCSCDVSLENQDASKLNFPDNSFDLIFSHQLLHHSSNQEATVKEFQRILAPGGLLLSAESCISFIHSLPVKLLFRHPRQSQKTAEEFKEVLRKHGFTINEEEVYTSAPWWSRPDLGLFEKLGMSPPKEPTEILMIAQKPAQPS